MADVNRRRLPPQTQDERQTALVINQVLDGKLNCVGTFTATAGAATTAISDFRCGLDSVILLMPITANAALEIGNGTIYVSATAKQSFTVNHANNSQSDRSFRYILIG